MKRILSCMACAATLAIAIVCAAPAADAAWVIISDQGEQCPAGFVSVPLKDGAGESWICVPAKSIQEGSTLPEDGIGSLGDVYFEGA